MKKFLILFIVSFVILFSRCASKTMIGTEPNDSKIYVDNVYIGNSPQLYKDYKISFACTNIKIEKEGYKPFETYICKNKKPHIGAIIGGVLIYIPWLWAIGYSSTYNFELELATTEADTNQTTPEHADYEKLNENFYKQNNQQQDTNNLNKLQELKQLYDKGILTEEEYQTEKQKILNKHD